MKARKASKEVSGAVEYRFRDLWIVWSHHAVERIKQRLTKDDLELNIPHRRIYKAAKRNKKHDCRVRFKVDFGSIRFGCLLVGNAILIRTVIKLE